MVEVSVDPEFGHDAHTVFADEAVALPALEGDEVAFDVVFGGEFFVGGAGGDGDGTFKNGPHLAATVMVLPAEALTRIDHEDFGAQTYTLPNGDALDAGKELIRKRLGVLFRDDEEATPGALEVLIHDGKAEGLNPGGGLSHCVHVRELVPLK